MKKILTVLSFFMIYCSSGILAQSNVTWTIKDHLTEGMKSTTVFNSNFSGLKNADAGVALCQKWKANPDVLSCDIIKNSGTNCDVKLVMKQVHNKAYFARIASGMGIAYIEANGKKKTPAEWLEKKK
jgi:hypothetical protein